MSNRRDFLRAVAVAGAAITVGRDRAFGELLQPRAPVKLKILFLGGTGFIGPHQVNAALARGHEVSVFNRGRSGKGMFGSKVEELTGDRATDLKALEGRKWDVVIDESASRSDAPEWVKLSANLLKDSVQQYLFISTRSVYYDLSKVPMDSNAPVLTLENRPLAEGAPLSYGHAKAYAEKEAHKAMPGRVTVVRPGLIVGPGDDTDRFTYWPVKLAAGGEILAPGDGTDRVQIIDVRDLAEFSITLAENRTYGVFNGIGPDRGMPFTEFLAQVQRGVNGNAQLTWVDTDFLLDQKVRPYADLPVWQVARGRTTGFAQFDLTPELKAGLKVRSMEATARDTIEWWRTLPKERQVLKAGMKPEREKELLALWKARKG